MNLQVFSVLFVFCFNICEFLFFLFDYYKECIFGFFKDKHQLHDKFNEYADSKQKAVNHAKKDALFKK